MFMWLTVIILVGFVLIVLSGIRITQEYQRAVVFRLGRFHSVRGPGSLRHHGRSQVTPWAWSCAACR